MYEGRWISERKNLLSCGKIMESRILFVSLLAGNGAGLTIGNNKYMSTNIEQTAYHESFHVTQQEGKGWAYFYGRIVWEYIKYIPTCGLNGFLHPKDTLEYDAYKASRDLFHP